MRLGLVASTGKHLDSFFPDICAELERRGISVHAAAGTPTSTIKSTVIPSITQRPKLVNVAASTALRAWARSNCLDAVLTNTATASTLVRMANLRIPILYFCHGLHWNTGRVPAERVWVAVERSLLRFTDGLIVINSDDRAWFEAYAPEKPTLVLNSGVGLPSSYFDERRENWSRDVLRLAWIGDFSPRKRPLDAVEVARHLSLLGRAFQLKMVGDGALLQKAQRLAGAYGLGDVVSFEGRLPSSRLVLDWANAVVHTSRWEGLPRVLLEAAARDRRAVAYDVKGVRDIPDVLLTPKQEPRMLADRILAAEGDGTLYRIPRAQPALDSSATVGAKLAAFAMSITGNERTG